MRQITRSYTQKPAILKNSVTLAELETIARTGNTSLIKQNFYSDSYKTKDGNRSKVLDKLAYWYKGKCAYCERRYKLDVEHYRPKGRITDENGQLIAASGYYWLCYEWSNLLPSCISCNREGGKVDKFPIIGSRVTLPSFRNGRLVKRKCLTNYAMFIAETPYLVNPEIDNPVNFFSFRIADSGKGIEIYGTDADNRGTVTQQICKLNRLELRIERAQIIQEFTEAAHSIFKLYQNGNRTLNELKQGVDNLLQTLYDQSKNIELTHTLLRQFIISSNHNFQEIVIPFVTPKLRKIISAAFGIFTPI